MKVQFLYKFDNPIEQRKTIREVTNLKPGIYSWFNRLNGKAYVGSASNLYSRICSYLRPNYLLKNQDMVIVRAIKAHGFENFSLLILEFNPERAMILESEQRYLDFDIFEYNVAKYAHGSEYRAPLTEETRAKMSKSRMGELNPNYNVRMSQEQKDLISSRMEGNTYKPSFKVTVLDLITDITTNYSSIRKAAEALNSDIKSILRREGSEKPYRNRYIITIHRNLFFFSSQSESSKVLFALMMALLFLYAF